MILKIKSKINSSLQNKDFKELISGSSVVFIAKVVATLIGLVFNLMVARIYGPESMGILALVNSFLAIALIPSLFGLQTSILRFIPEYIKKSSFFEALQIYKRSLIIVLIFSIVISMIVWFNAGYIAEYIFKKPEFTMIFSIAAIFLVFKSVGHMNQSALRAFKDFKLFALLSVLTPLFNILVLIVLNYVIEDIYNPVYAIFSTSVFVCLLTFLFLKKVIEKNKTDKLFSKQTLHIKQIITISAPMFLTSVMGTVITQTDIIMLGMYSDIEQVGIYAVVVKLALLTTFVLSSINVISAPRFSESFHSGDMDKLKTIVKKSSKLIFFTTLPIVLFLLVFGKFTLGLFGEEFTIGYTAMVILLIGQFVNISVGSVGYLMNMTGYQKEYNYIIIASAIINIIINYILIPIYGTEGAAIASVVSLIFWNVISLTYVKIKLNFYCGYLPLKG